MREINIQTWPRSQHFKTFNAFNHPHFNMSANIDLTDFVSFVKHREFNFTIATVYVITRAANAVPEFRFRIQGEKVIEHEVVNPGVTILVDDDLFTFCTLDYVENFTEFASAATERISYVKANPTLDMDPNKDNMLYMTALPWVSFTSFTHPMQFHPTDSIPRFAWGRYFEEGESIKMPLSVQGHHALMDGIHMARFYREFESCVMNPSTALGNG
jgi:chloramphenicol O-acetyltransferase type A